MARVIISIIALLFTAMPLASAAEFADDQISLTISSKSITKSVTEGGNPRGPALAVLSDDTILLGGGRSGGEIFTFNTDGKNLRKLGSFISANKRIIDSRFAINDIAILSETPLSAKVLISYPRLGASGSCIEIAIDELAYDRK